MQTLLQDLRYGVRMLAKKPGFAFVAIITLALGIGANTAIFSVINAVLLRPLPYAEADRLVWLTERHEEIPSRWISYPNFLDWRDRNQSFEAMATIRGWQMTMTGSGEAQSVTARMVTADYFRVMRAYPLLGRDFNSEEDKFGAPSVAVFSHTFWQTAVRRRPRHRGQTDHAQQPAFHRHRRHAEGVSTSGAAFVVGIDRAVCSTGKRLVQSF